MISYLKINSGQNLEYGSVRIKKKPPWKRLMPPFAIIWWLRKNYNMLKTYWSAKAEMRSVTSGKTDQFLAECVVRWAGICIHVFTSFYNYLNITVFFCAPFIWKLCSTDRVNILPKNKKKVSLERLSWNCNALRLICSCCYFVESFYLIIRTNDRNCLFFIVYTHMYWTRHFYRQVKCLSISTEHRGIPCIFLCIMSVNKFLTGFHIHVFYKIPVFTDNFCFEKCFRKLLIIRYGPHNTGRAALPHKNIQLPRPQMYRLFRNGICIHFKNLLTNNYIINNRSIRTGSF